jgi:hypothetical protein
MIEPLSAALDRAAEMLSNPRSIHRIVISGLQRGKQPEFERIDIRPVELKGQLHFQATSHDGRRDTTKNYLPHDLSLAALMNLGFGNLLIETTDEEMNLRITKSGDAQVNVKARSQKLDSIDLSHDRKKTRYLTEDELIFRELGISDHNGKLKASRSDKFIQVNEFLKIIDHAVSELERDSRVGARKEFSLVDLGCGNAYLTFAAHQYLLNKGLSVKTVGVDSRKDSRERNEKIAKRAYLSQEITFIAEEIDSYPPHAVDITVALHACDTATDDAISWAVESKSQVILVAPCCHHDIQKQIKKAPEPWGIATKHGILKERIGDIVTDAIRAQVLRVLGYRTDVIEFVAGDHTPRNLMIRAIYTGASAQQHDFDELDALIQQWGIEPALLSRLDAAIAAQRKSALG